MCHLGDVKNLVTSSNKMKATSSLLESQSTNNFRICLYYNDIYRWILRFSEAKFYLGIGNQLVFYCHLYGDLRHGEVLSMIEEGWT